MRTFGAALLALLLAYAGARWITHDFQVWTAEGARRLEVALAPVDVPDGVVAGPAAGSPGAASTAASMGPPRAPRGTRDEERLRALLAVPGRVTILDFIYTRCVTVCAALGTTFQQMQGALASAAQGGDSPVRLLSISFDPAHDDAAALGAYARRLRADPRLWRFASVPDAQTLATLLARLQVTVIADGLGGYEHNGALLIVDASGRLVRIFDYAEADDALVYARWLASRGGRA